MTERPIFPPLLNNNETSDAMAMQSTFSMIKVTIV